MMHYTSLPKSVKVGHVEYAVVVLNAPREDRYGSCHYHTQEIHVNPGLKPVILANTILHEVIHAINYHYSNAGGEAIGEERFTDSVANGLCCVMMNNKKLVVWLMVCLGLGR